MGKKKLLCCIIAIVVIAGLASVFPLATSVHVSYDAVLWTQDEVEAAEPCSITVAGTYKRYLWRDNVFTGRLRVSAVELLAENESITLTFRADTQLYDGNVAELYVYNSRTNRQEHLGYLVISGTFKELLLCLDDNTTWIAAPAVSVQEAEAVAGSLRS